MPLKLLKSGVFITAIVAYPFQRVDIGDIGRGLSFVWRNSIDRVFDENVTHNEIWKSLLNG